MPKPGIFLHHPLHQLRASDLPGWAGLHGHLGISTLVLRERARPHGLQHGFITCPLRPEGIHLRPQGLRCTFRVLRLLLLGSHESQLEVLVGRRLHRAFTHGVGLITLEPAKTQWGSFSLDQQKATCAQSEKSDVVRTHLTAHFPDLLLAGSQPSHGQKSQYVLHLANNKKRPFASLLKPPEKNIKPIFLSANLEGNYILKAKYNRSSSREARIRVPTLLWFVYFSR